MKRLTCEIQGSAYKLMFPGRNVSPWLLGKAHKHIMRFAMKMTVVKLTLGVAKNSMREQETKTNSKNM